MGRSESDGRGGHGLRECSFILAQIYKETMMRIIIMMILIKTNIGEMNRSIVKGWACTGRA